MTKDQGAVRVETCRMCGGKLGDTLLSLGHQPISNQLPKTAEDAENAARFPLAVAACESCRYVQLTHDLPADAHFHDDYAYVSSASSTWLDHCRNYARDVREKYGVREGALAVEVGSNDGAFLQALKDEGLDILGIEPSGNVAQIANDKGLRTMNAFFGAESAEKAKAEYGPAACVIGNNVLAHVPDTDGFLKAGKALIAEDGFLCFEFPHVLHVIDRMFVDTIYHEHYGYLGVRPLHEWAKRNGMVVAAIDPQTTHGGSLRVILRHASAAQEASDLSVWLQKEEPVESEAAWHALSDRLAKWRKELRSLIDKHKKAGRKIAGYAAASKATVLANYVGLTGDDLDYCCDASPFKQGRFIPGAAIKIRPPDAMRDDAPDVSVVFAWNIFDELSRIIGTLIDYPIDVIRPLPEIKTVTIAPESRS
ncbi:class I SAM-dependent methyltransferase [Parvularcula lutaonensis]|uniref:Methyltransferase domain-containing protein n=1 Tax=Parvularcula lutaonensis TaxID=491923 RepID=A0ABV7MA96_9PROT|nr:class I SAM-dependent methyltransferase [Parvularcula lutaonensis]GGY44487.1 SAM-dependent methyltransferase [Parvularcula lutaonensis]